MYIFSYVYICRIWLRGGFAQRARQGAEKTDTLIPGYVPVVKNILVLSSHDLIRSPQNTDSK